MMKHFWSSIVFVCAIQLSTGIHGDIQCQYDTVQCLGQVVEYQCTVNGSVPLILTWRILDNNGTELDGRAYTSTILASDTDTIGGGVFTVEQLSTSPLVSNISFTVQSSINGYTIICEDGITMNNENFTITIPDIPAPPETLLIHDGSFTTSSIFVSWMESSSVNLTCFAGYRCIVSSAALNSSIVLNTTSTSAMMNSLIPSDYLYNVEVFAVDIADRLSRNNDTTTFFFNVPPEPSIGNISSIQISNTTANITVRWMLHYNVGPSVILPETTFVVIVYNTTEDINDKNKVDSSLVLPNGSSVYTFVNLSSRENYTIEVMAINGVGNTSSIGMVFLDYFVGRKESTSSTSSTQGSSALYPSSTEVISIDDVSNVIGAIAGGVTSGVIVILLIVLLVPVTYFVCIKNREFVNFVDEKKTLGLDYETPISTTRILEVKSNAAYGQVNVPEMKSNVAYGQVHLTTASTDRQTSTTVYEIVNVAPTQ